MADIEEKEYNEMKLSQLVESLKAGNFMYAKIVLDKIYFNNLYFNKIEIPLHIANVILPLSGPYYADVLGLIEPGGSSVKAALPRK